MKTKNTEAALTSVKANNWWEAISSIDAAKKLASQGTWAAGFVSAVTLLLTVVGITFGASVEGLPTFDAWSFIDVGIYVAIARYIYKMSRIAAVAGLILYTLDRIYLLVLTNLSGSAIPMSIIVILMFVNAIRGTFAYHRLSNQENRSE
jgi:hypothetical protein